MKSQLLIALGAVSVATIIPMQVAQAATPEIISSLISQDQ